jgi:hypothetical protein
MIEMMIVAAIVSSMTLRVAGNVAVDGFFAMRGQESPRYTRAKARRTPGAATRYWSEVWDDVWTGMSARRAARKSARSAAPRPRGAATSYWAGWWQDRTRAAGRRWEDGWVRLDEKRREKATRPRPGQVTVPGTVLPNVQDEDENRPGPEPRVVPTDDGGTDLRFGDDDTDPTGVSSCPECGGTVLVDGEICLTCRDRQEQRNQHHDDNSGPDSGPDNDTPSPATPTTEGTPTMTTTMPTDTEVTSLNKAIQYSESTAHVAREMVNSIDFTVASLAAGGVTGVAVAEFTAAKEGFGSIAAAFERAAKEFKDQLAIQEAYNANPGAGSKEFIMGGR